MYELQRLLANREIVVELLTTLAIVAVGLWVVMSLLNLSERLSKKECPSCLRVTRSAKKCRYCGGAI